MDKRQQAANEQLAILKEKYAAVREDKSVPLTERVKKAERIHNILKALELEAKSGPAASDIIDRVARPKRKDEEEDE